MATGFAHRRPLNLPTLRQAAAIEPSEEREGQRLKKAEAVVEIVFDWGAGPTINGRATLLWCAWLTWSRFRVLIPTWDRSLATVVACLDETLRRIGGRRPMG